MNIQFVYVCPCSPDVKIWTEGIVKEEYNEESLLPNNILPSLPPPLLSNPHLASFRSSL